MKERDSREATPGGLNEGALLPKSLKCDGVKTLASTTTPPMLGTITV